MKHVDKSYIVKILTDNPNDEIYLKEVRFPFGVQGTEAYNIEDATEYENNKEAYDAAMNLVYNFSKQSFVIIEKSWTPKYKEIINYPIKK